MEHREKRRSHFRCQSLQAIKNAATDANAAKNGALNRQIPQQHLQHCTAAAGGF
jgi:hypothetical protein